MTHDQAQAEQAYLECLQHFGETNQHNAQKFNNLRVTNAQMASNITTVLQKLQTQIQELACTIQQEGTPPTRHLLVHMQHHPNTSPNSMTYLLTSLTTKAVCSNTSHNNDIDFNRWLDAAAEEETNPTEADVMDVMDIKHKEAESVKI
jgi:hypothetical protein